MFHQLFLLSSVALLVSGQGPPPPASASGCTSRSFTTPSWLVEKFKAASGNVSFHLFNRATNATTDIACKVSGTNWSACTASEKLDLDASIQLDGATANLKVNETWVCKDREGSERLTFSASGSSAIALTGTGELSSKNPLILLRGTLSSPIAVKPAYLEGPTGHDMPGCRAASQTPSWVLSSAHFVDQGGDGITSAASMGMSLVMTNPSNGYQVSCMADNGFSGGEASAPGDPLRLACAGYEFQSSTIGRYSLSTTASIDPTTLLFSISQTWYCDDTDPGRPVAIKASASEILPLQCRTATIQGDFTRRTCEADKEITIKGKLLSEDPLPAFSIEDPVPGADGCTLSSIFKPQWALSSFTIDGGAAGASTSNSGPGAIRFNIILQTGTRGFQYPIEISQGAPVANSAGWYQCEVGPDGGIGQPLWPYGCTLRYSAEAKELTIKADWACVDLDREHPVHFSGVTTTIIDSSITCESSDGLQRCQTADPGYNWVAGIANVTWKATP